MLPQMSLARQLAWIHAFDCYRSANKSHAPEVLDFTSRSFTMKWHVSSWGNNGEGRSELTEEDLLENNSLLWRREATAPLDEPKLDDHEFDGW